jgi:hypothetical protein
MVFVPRLSQLWFRSLADSVVIPDM